MRIGPLGPLSAGIGSRYYYKGGESRNIIIGTGGEEFRVYNNGVVYSYGGTSI